MPVNAFQYVYLDERLQNYDRSKNKDRLNVWQLSADGLTWGDGTRFVRMFEEKGTACLCPDRSGFAIVESSLNVRKSRLYFINEHDQVLQHAPLPEKLSRLQLVPYDTLLSDGLVKVIFVDPTNQPYDYQVDYDPADLTVMRWDYWK